jgi:hypothetical protein
MLPDILTGDMQGQYNPRVIGAVVIGFTLVGAAFVLSGFTEPRITDVSQQMASARQAPEAPARVPIEVVDADNNGIEDWRDEFVTTKPVILNQATSTYTPPDTLTGDLGINFFQNIVRSRGYGPFGQTDEEVIENTVNTLTQITETTIYDTPDIIILEEWTDQDIVNYANRMALSLIENDVPELEGELFILEDILTTQNTSRLSELEALAMSYQAYRDDALNPPVPAIFVKEHLDLINTYNALHEDIAAMTLAVDDPAVTLLRLKRYEDDATGLGYALQNMFNALWDYSDLFTINDPAALFTLFSAEYQSTL